jgi:hypothetical protein
MPFSEHRAKAILEALEGEELFVQLHTGDPGLACTANVAAETTRQAATFGVISGDAITNTSDILWEPYGHTEGVDWVSIWTAASGGNPEMYGEMDALVELIEGQDFKIASGKLKLMAV